MKLNRLTIFLLGFALIVAVYFAQRAYVYHNSEFTHGMFVCDNPAELLQYEADLSLHYYVDGKEFVVQSRDETKLAYHEVQVRYPKGSPEKGRYFTSGRFWGLSALWLLIPTMLWGALVFTLFNENSGIQLSINKNQPKKSSNNLLKT
ncbi:MAG: hypothetical protein IKN98_10080 [Bacteroidales bacterium]|nr:hypothetical protein [Bacteroidales bacterium]